MIFCLQFVRLAEDAATYLRSAVIQTKFESQTKAYSKLLGIITRIHVNLLLCIQCWH